MNPTAVFLRCGKAAHVTGRVTGPWPFALIGRTVEEGRLELWQENGRWRESGEAHPLDIVSLVTAGGALVAFAGESPV